MCTCGMRVICVHLWYESYMCGPVVRELHVWTYGMRVTCVHLWYESYMCAPVV